MLQLSKIGIIAIFLHPLPVLAHAGESIPVYLFSDVYFWLLAAVNLLGLPYIAYLLVRGIRRIAGGTVTVPRVLLSILTLFILVIGYQIFHQIEHVAQVHQYWFVGEGAEHSAGILWFFNIEWNHFIFNSVYIAVLVTIFVLFLRAVPQDAPYRRLHVAVLASMLVIQGWHATEHIVRITQHIALGCEPCPGIADRVFGLGLIYLHYWYNVAALLVTEVVFIWLGLHTRAWHLLKNTPWKRAT